MDPYLEAADKSCHQGEPGIGNPDIDSRLGETAKVKE